MSREETFWAELNSRATAAFKLGLPTCAILFALAVTVDSIWVRAPLIFGLVGMTVLLCRIWRDIEVSRSTLEKMHGKD